MAESEIQPEQGNTPPADGHPESIRKRTIGSLKSIFAIDLPALHIPAGALVLILVIEFLINPFFADMDNSWSIWLMSRIHNSVVTQKRYTFVDIDNNTFSEWRTSGGHTDRSKIKGLIEKNSAQ